MNNSTVTAGSSTNSADEINGPVNIFLYTSSLLFGLPTHSYVIWLIVTGTESGVASEFFNLNLSVCELGSCLNVILTLLSLLFSSVNIHFLKGLGISGRPVFQCLMCVERYLAVVHPVTFLKYKPLRYRLICCAVAWIIILGSCFFSMFNSFTDNELAYRWVFSTQFLLFFSIQLFCLVAVLRALKQSGPGERKREEGNRMKRRAFYLILIITVSMITTYVPYTLIGFSYLFTHLFIKELFNFSYICFMLAGFVQPVLYLQRAGKLSIPSLFCKCVN